MATSWVHTHRNQQTPPTCGHRSRSVSVERRTGLPPRPSVPHSRSSSVDSKSSSRRSSVDSADSRGSIRNMLRNSQSKGRKPGSRNSLKGLEHLAKFLFTKWLSLFSDHTVRVMSERHVIKWVQRMQRMCVCGFNTPCLQMVASTPKTSGSTVKLSGLCSSVFVCVLTRGKCGKLS